MTHPFVALFPALDCEARSRDESLIAVHIAESGGVDMSAAFIAGNHFCSQACVAMNEARTTAVIHRFPDELQVDTPAEPLIRDLPERAVDRLRPLCGALLAAQ